MTTKQEYTASQDRIRHNAFSGEIEEVRMAEALHDAALILTKSGKTRFIGIDAPTVRAFKAGILASILLKRTDIKKVLDDSSNSAAEIERDALERAEKILSKKGWQNPNAEGMEQGTADSIRAEIKAGTRRTEKEQSAETAARQRVSSFFAKHKLESVNARKRRLTEARLDREIASGKPLSEAARKRKASKEAAAAKKKSASQPRQPRTASNPPEPKPSTDIPVFTKCRNGDDIDAQWTMFLAHMDRQMKGLGKSDNTVVRRKMLAETQKRAVECGIVEEPTKESTKES